MWHDALSVPLATTSRAWPIPALPEPIMTLCAPAFALVMHGPYKLFFEQTNEALRLLRVIHGARNVSPDELEGAAG